MPQLDENALKYRSILQVERDVELNELINFGFDLKSRIIERQEKKLNFLVSKEDEKLIMKYLEKVANAHFRLKFGDLWYKMDIKKQDVILENVKIKILEILLDPNTNLEFDISVATITLLEQEIKNVAGIIGQI